MDSFIIWGSLDSGWRPLFLWMFPVAGDVESFLSPGLMGRMGCRLDFSVLGPRNCRIWVCVSGLIASFNGPKMFMVNVRGGWVRFLKRLLLRGNMVLNWWAYRGRDSCVNGDLFKWNISRSFFVKWVCMSNSNWDVAKLYIK